MIEGLLLGLLIALVSSGTTFIVMLYRHDDGGRGRWPDELPPWLLPSLDDPNRSSARIEIRNPNAP